MLRAATSPSIAPPLAVAASNLTAAITEAPGRPDKPMADVPMVKASHWTGLLTADDRHIMHGLQKSCSGCRTIKLSLCSRVPPGYHPSTTTIRCPQPAQYMALDSEANPPSQFPTRS
jgi:hypothetical protein